MIYCFSGPTLNSTQLSIFPQVSFLPPIKSGDLNTLLLNKSNRVQSVIIIDGLYHSSLSIRHKEIIAAIKRGIKVYGAGSIGALRAAELNGYGMIGHGEVFHYYANNLITSDDEVSVVHDPCSPFTSYSLPTINLRLSIPSLIKQGLISGIQSSDLLSFYESLHYTERTRSRFIHYLKEVGLDPSLVDHITDYKLKDSIELLSHVTSTSNDRTMNICDTQKQNHVDFGYYFENFFTDQRFPIDNLKSEKAINDFKSVYSPIDSHFISYNSLNRHASLLLCRSIEIDVCQNEIEAMKNFLTYISDQFKDISSIYSPLIEDPLFLDTISREETLLLKLHIFLVERMGNSVLTRQRHFWLSSYFNSTVDLTLDSICQVEFSNEIQKLFTNFSSNKFAFDNFL
jgi:hypothetical protein